MAAKPIDKALIRKIRFGKKNMRTQPKIIKFDPRSPDTRNRDETSFEKLCECYNMYVITCAINV